jgi:hypothetical protein
MRRSTKILRPRRGFHAFYRAVLPLSARTLSYVAEVISRHRAKIGSCWRKLNPGRQALLPLARWADRQSHQRPSNPRDRRMKTFIRPGLRRPTVTPCG